MTKEVTRATKEVTKATKETKAAARMEKVSFHYKGSLITQSK